MASKAICFILLIACASLGFCIPVESIGYATLVPYIVVANLYDSCPRNTTNRSNFDDLLMDGYSCFVNISQSNEPFCDEFEGYIQNCSQPTVDVLVDCLPEELEDMPELVVKIFTSIGKAICSSSGELLLEVLNDCLYPDRGVKLQREECNLETIEKNGRKVMEPTSKSDYCLGLREVGSCWQDFVNQNCKSSKSKEFFTKFHNAVLSNCKS